MATTANIQHEILEIVGLIIVVFILVGIFSQFAFTVGEALTSREIFDNFGYYYPPLLLGLFLIIALKVGEIIAPDKYRGIIHDPNRSILKGTVVERLMSPFKLMLLVLGIASIPSMYGVLQRSFLGTGIPPPLQQISPLAKLYFAIEPAVTAETLFFIGMISLGYTLLKVIQLSFKLSDSTISIIAFSTFWIVFGLLGVGWHSFAYKGQEQSLIAVFLFWGIGAEFTLLFESVIFLWVWHFINNSMFSLANIIENDILVVSVYAFTLFIIFVLFIMLSLRKKQREKSVVMGT